MFPPAVSVTAMLTARLQELSVPPLAKQVANKGLAHFQCRHCKD